MKQNGEKADSEVQEAKLLEFLEKYPDSYITSIRFIELESESTENQVMIGKSDNVWTF